MRLEEHAVSIVNDGPVQSKKYDIRFEGILRAVPVLKYYGKVSGSRNWISV